MKAQDLMISLHGVSKAIAQRRSLISDLKKAMTGRLDYNHSWNLTTPKSYLGKVNYGLRLKRELDKLVVIRAEINLILALKDLLG